MINSLEFNPKNKVKYDKMVIDLLSRYYPFTRKDLIDFKESLNFKYVLENEQIEWDKPLIEELKEYIYWQQTNFDKIIDVDYEFVKKYISKLSISSLAFSDYQKKWDVKLLELFGDKVLEWYNNQRFINDIVQKIQKFNF